MIDEGEKEKDPDPREGPEKIEQDHRVQHRVMMAAWVYYPDLIEISLLYVEHYGV